MLKHTTLTALTIALSSTTYAVVPAASLDEITTSIGTQNPHAFISQKKVDLSEEICNEYTALKTLWPLAKNFLKVIFHHALA